MIGIWQAYSGPYLTVAGVAMLATFGLPLLLAPMRWAQLFRWEAPSPGRLTVFLGRSLGVFLCVFGAYAIKAAVTPAAQPFMFELLLWLLGAMLAFHIYGAVWKVQPITETMEIGVWVVLFLATLGFWPAA